MIIKKKNLTKKKAGNAQEFASTTFELKINNLSRVCRGRALSKG